MQNVRSLLHEATCYSAPVQIRLYATLLLTVFRSNAANELKHRLQVPSYPSKQVSWMDRAHKEGGNDDAYPVVLNEETWGMKEPCKGLVILPCRMNSRK